MNRFDIKEGQLSQLTLAAQEYLRVNAMFLSTSVNPTVLTLGHIVSLGHIVLTLGHIFKLEFLRINHTALWFIKKPTLVIQNVQFVGTH